MSEHEDIVWREQREETCNLIINIHKSLLSKVNSTAHNPVSVTLSAHASAHCGLIFILN